MFRLITIDYNQINGIVPINLPNYFKPQKLWLFSSFNLRNSNLQIIKSSLNFYYLLSIIIITIISLNLSLAKQANIYHTIQLKFLPETQA